MQMLNIELEERTDFTLRVVYTDDTTNLPIDITGWDAILQIRQQWGADPVYEELSVTEDSIVLGGQSGTVDIIFVPVDTEQTQMKYGWTNAVYDLVLIDTAGKRKKLLKGFVTIERSATLGP